MTNDNDLEQLSQQIEDAKKNIATFEGRIQQSMKQLKDDFQLNSLEAAQKESEILQKQVAQLEIEVTNGIAELRETYSW